VGAARQGKKKENSPRGGLAWMDGLTSRPPGPGATRLPRDGALTASTAPATAATDPIAFWRCSFAARRVVAVDDVEDGLGLDAICYASLERA